MTFGTGVYSFSPSHTRLTTRLRPTCDRKMLQSCAYRRKNIRLVAEVVRLVAEVVGDRKGQISRSKVVVMFKTQSHRAYDQVTTNLPAIEKCLNRGPTVERTYDWSQRSWAIARGKSAAIRSMVMFKTGRANLRPVVPPIDCSLAL